jgi:hypothetical protein
MDTHAVYDAAFLETEMYQLVWLIQVFKHCLWTVGLVMFGSPPSYLLPQTTFEFLPVQS